MVPVVIYNDNVFQKRPWLLYLLSGVMAFSLEVNWKRMFRRLSASCIKAESRVTAARRRVSSPCRSRDFLSACPTWFLAPRLWYDPTIPPVNVWRWADAGIFQAHHQPASARLLWWRRGGMRWRRYSIVGIKVGKLRLPLSQGRDCEPQLSRETKTKPFIHLSVVFFAESHCQLRIWLNDEKKKNKRKKKYTVSSLCRPSTSDWFWTLLSRRTTKQKAPTVFLVALAKIISPLRRPLCPYLAFTITWLYIFFYPSPGRA